MKIEGTRIYMTRGDSETLTVKCATLPFESGDELTLTVRPTVYADVALQKVVTEFEEDGSAVFEIAPEDTEGLKFGGYIYDVQVVRADGTVTTLIKPKQNNFILCEEVTYGE